MSARIVHEVTFAAGAEVTVPACVSVAVAIAVAAVIARWLALDAIVVVVGAVVIAEHFLAFGVTVGAVVVVLGNLCLLWLRYRGHIAVSYS